MIFGLTHQRNEAAIVEEATSAVASVSVTGGSVGWRVDTSPT